MKAEILSVGTELLLGDIVNTNAKFLSKELASLGISVYYQLVVGDNETRLLNALSESFKRSDIVITTGGLGPTDDDITKEVGAKFFNKELILDEETLNKLESYFKTSICKITKNNIKQAYFPKDCIILKNNKGTAPGFFLEEDNKILIMLPGPPEELISMFLEEVKPLLQNKSNQTFFSVVLKTIGLGESAIEEMLKDILKNQTNPTIALYAKTNEVQIRLTANAKDETTALEIINPYKNKIENILGENIFSENNDSLETVVVKLLQERKFTLSVAESCTGGMLSSTFVNHSGISEIFLEGCVTYSNEAKIKRLNVAPETLEKYGAVSKETAIEMAIGIAKSLNTNVGISTTGIAGPTGFTKEKPIGLVYIGLYINGKTFSKELNLRGDRENIRKRSTICALDFLRRALIIYS